MRTLEIAAIKIQFSESFSSLNHSVLYNSKKKNSQMVLEKRTLRITHLPSLFPFQGIFPCGLQSSLYFPDFYSPHSLWQFQVRLFFKALWIFSFSNKNVTTSDGLQFMPFVFVVSLLD